MAGITDRAWRTLLVRDFLSRPTNAVIGRDPRFILEAVRQYIVTFCRRRASKTPFFANQGVMQMSSYAKPVDSTNFDRHVLGSERPVLVDSTSTGVDRVK
jgi:hypothetical protein